MVADDSVPWYNRPPREFPAQKWLKQRYGFILPPLVFASPAPPARVATLERRRFPALLWVEENTRKSLAQSQES